MELAVNLRDPLPRDRGRQRHAQPRPRVRVERVLQGHGGEGGCSALPPLPHVVHGPRVPERSGERLRKPDGAALGVVGGARSGSSLAYRDGS